MSGIWYGFSIPWYHGIGIKLIYHPGMGTLKNLLFEYNVQHDCQKAHCTASGRQPVVQEHIEIEKQEDFILHKTLDEYLVNTHRFHNAHLVRAVLPRELIALIPYTPTAAAKKRK
ncbi:uncharacterized protein LACBIDRAFT_309761 [Laccaria bicolor S238N-H82]|uniref:Predicted protein n=1 Tax=Laccaria bicolor (strain S238N-H82 / ATCC MYA-4686) TaxID=486041 RepID=B0DT12_LACBS|nr:uncharacterized protein LACBIDRAFT_309761 [Laccaria bicolor S238N-H82]EDR02332.1 predicted protein [Laccaria bicolor S238N-H82]|eukprot:XP_001887009.1 predicted protein [Laccaria bicolor S238N-H82]